MAKMFVANCSRQRQIIMYRLDYEPDGTPNQLRRYVQAKASPAIIPGQQIVLHGDLDLETQIPHIIAQLEVFGLTAEKDIGRLTKATPYIFNIDRPVKAASIEAVMDFNRGVLTREGADRRKAAAIAASAVLETKASENNIRRETFETSIEQESLVTDESRLEEGYRLGDPRGPNAPPEPTRRAGRRRAA